MNNPATEPRVHHPSLREEPPGALYCFLNDTRECNASCMAWTPPPDGPDYKDKQWASCHLLVNAHRGGKHLVVLAQVGSELAKTARDEAADRARTGQPAPPKVR